MALLLSQLIAFNRKAVKTTEVKRKKDCVKARRLNKEDKRLILLKTRLILIIGLAPIPLRIGF